MHSNRHVSGGCDTPRLCRFDWTTQQSISRLWMLSGTSSTRSWMQSQNRVQRSCCRAWQLATLPHSTLQTVTSSVLAGYVLFAATRLPRNALAYYVLCASLSLQTSCHTLSFSGPGWHWSSQLRQRLTPETLNYRNCCNPRCPQVTEEDLQRVSQATGAQVQTTVNGLGESALGTCAQFQEKQVSRYMRKARMGSGSSVPIPSDATGMLADSPSSTLKQVGGERYNLFTGCPKARTATFVLRGGSEQVINVPYPASSQGASSRGAALTAHRLHPALDLCWPPSYPMHSFVSNSSWTRRTARCTTPS
jgi:hypothetical protein